MHPIRCISVQRLPGDAVVLITDRDGVIYVYMSESHDMVTVCEALTAAAENVRAKVIALPV